MDTAFFREHSKSIRIYRAVEIETDPYEHTVETTYLPSLPVKAIVSDISPASSQWKMPGIVTEKTKQIIIEKKYEKLLLRSHKIVIRGDTADYYGWRINGRLTYKTVGKYLEVYIYVKKEA